MATRLYLSATTAATPISPTPDSGWDITTSFVRRNMSTTKDASTIATKATGSSGVPAAGNRDLLNVQFVSAALAGGTISGTVKAQILSSISSVTSKSGKMTFSVRVIAPDGTTVRGTVYSSLAVGIGSDLVTTLTNRSIPSGTSVSSVVATAGDYLVIEIGWTYLTGSGAANSSNSFGSSSGIDLPEDQTTTTANDPWIEFSANLFSAGPVNTNRGFPLYML